MNSTEYITVLSYSLLLFLGENNDKKYVFQQGNARIHVKSHRVWISYVTNLLRFYCGQLAFLTWILLKKFEEFLYEEYIQITDNLSVLKI